MAYLGRKFTLAKWAKIEDLVCADGVTYCLRTSKNTLSFWVAPELNDQSIKDIVLAFVANGEKLEKQEIILIDEQFFIDNNLTVVNTDGNTKVDDLIKNHKDIVSLNIRKLEVISNKILNQVEELRLLDEDQLDSYMTIKMYDQEEVKEILLVAIREGRLKESSLNSKLLEKLNNN